MSSQTPDAAVSIEGLVLGAAERLLAATPGASFTMDQLAAKAHVSRATIYRRLGNKAALLQRLADERGLDIKELAGADVQTRILQAARIAFGRKGLTRTTMEEIAAEAGLGVATLYRHFGDRESLVRAFLQAHAPRRAFQEVARQSQGDIEADLTHLVMHLLTFLHENRDMIWLGLVEGESTERLLARLLEAPRGTRTDLVRFFQAAVASGQLQAADPEHMTTALAGLLAAFSLQLPVFGGPPLHDPQGTAEFIVNLFLKGLAPHDSAPASKGKT
jgi:AcrR family transcriptional regulator